ncbi:hypothetical protein N657DRAFT_643998 [Parathielavia appendiculata]|uniref:Uncharacterized protein n=1 Tax=Parathielavia appendiculata TaxID=2587402 RepID=A0AAN6U2F5_9PEZI|nr:hypothetical protein N657DRAFT_643998 [Parathielavia appendiculata]
MARHGSVGAFSGFSVCQPALGAPLQWLPAIGTPELDDMINASLPGPASIQDKRAHISMDFFEYARQTGETFKFYPVPSASFTPVTASPATSALYDSGYASSSFNHSPVLSDRGSWTQSPVSFVPAVTDAGTKARTFASKKSSNSSTRQQAVDFANHPGMRILTKDGKDVTNSASRGCKTKEQRDHAHLMRIIKACDSCRRKKVRCDPSHRKRNASQASAAQADQKPAKRPKKAGESTPVAVVAAPADFVTADAFGPEALSFPTLETSYPENFEEYWNEFTTLDHEPVTVASGLAIDEFFFDSFTDLQSFVSPSSGSSATSPSQILTPFSPARPGASPVAAPNVTVEVSGEVSLEDLTVPYLNPGVAHGTNYVDFSLYSPGPEVFDEDPVLQMRELRSQQQSPQSPRHVAHHTIPQNSLSTSVVDVAWATHSGEQSAGERYTISTSPVDLAWYYDPGDTTNDKPRRNSHNTRASPTMTDHNRLVEEETGGSCGGGGRSLADRHTTNRMRPVDGHGSEVFVNSSTSTPVSQTSAPAALYGSTSTVVANDPQSSVSPGTRPRPRRVTATSPDSPSSPVRSPGSGVLAATVKSSLPSATACPRSSLGGLDATSSTAGRQLCEAVSIAACGGLVRSGQGCPSSTVPSEYLAGRESGSSACLDGQHAVQQGTVAVNAILAMTTMLFSTLPTRRNVVGDDVAYITSSFFQLAVFGLVSILCAAALQAHLASQVNLVNILAITSISLARLAPWCSGPSGAPLVGPKTLSPPTPSGIVDNVKSKIQSISGSLLSDLRSTVYRQARNLMPRLPSVQTLKL